MVVIYMEHTYLHILSSLSGLAKIPLSGSCATYFPILFEEPEIPAKPLAITHETI